MNMSRNCFLPLLVREETAGSIKTSGDKKERNAVLKSAICHCRPFPAGRADKDVIISLEYQNIYCPSLGNQPEIIKSLDRRCDIQAAATRLNFLNRICQFVKTSK